jgi:hypothetical protein
MGRLFNRPIPDGALVTVSVIAAIIAAVFASVRQAQIGGVVSTGSARRAPQFLPQNDERVGERRKIGPQPE